MGIAGVRKSTTTEPDGTLGDPLKERTEKASAEVDGDRASAVMAEIAAKGVREPS
jgi:hypothetical protein